MHNIMQKMTIEQAKEQKQQVQHDDEINLTKKQQQQQQHQQNQQHQQQQHQQYQHQQLQKHDANSNNNNLVDNLQKDVQKLTTNNMSPQTTLATTISTTIATTTNTTLSYHSCNNNETSNSYSFVSSESNKQKLQQHQTQNNKLHGDSSCHEMIMSSPKIDHNNQQQQQQQQHQHIMQQHPSHHLQQQHHHHHHQFGSSSTTIFKSCLCFGETTYHMKILVPAVASGAIIGKGGETIATLQKDTGARVKMSKSHDFYPGTTERVCLITGSVEGIMIVLDFIMDKIREKPDLTTKLIDSDSKQQDRDKQVKILVPNSTAGMIIGKAGSYIKQIKEESGSYVQISQKPKDISLQERCITIIGDKENNKNACKMILAKIVEDPQSGTCLNVSYADVNGPVANFNPTGSPYATNQNAINSSTASLNSNLGTAMSGTAAAASGLLINGAGINLSVNLGSPNPAPNLAVATQVLEHIKIAMRGAGYSDSATTEICTALGSLAKYGVLGIGVGVSHAANGAHPTLSNYLGVSALEQNAAQAASAAASNVFGAVGQVNLEQYAAAAAAAAAASRPSQLDAAQFDPFRHLSSAAAQTTPVSLNNNSFGLTAGTGTTSSAQQALNAVSAAHSLTAAGLSKSPTPGGDLSAKDSKNVEIPEVIVGAILGLNGRSLVEIQHSSGASVQISKKGIFAPGTRNRIVTITGPPSAIAKAQYLIEQKITEEETKRARQIPLTTVNC